MHQCFPKSTASIFKESLFYSESSGSGYVENNSLYTALMTNIFNRNCTLSCDGEVFNEKRSGQTKEGDKEKEKQIEAERKGGKQKRTKN
jgi:hypothetical protein